jgi:hypothetical protein
LLNGTYARSKADTLILIFTIHRILSRDGKGFKETGAEIGLGLRHAQHTYFNLSTDDSNRTDRITKASLTYSVPLGFTAESTSTTSSQSASMAEKLFTPVKRENRIRKKRLTLGVVAVGR